jgi:nitrogen fixation NifU-like protein
VVRISIRVRDGRIAEARFRTFGCGTAIACSSVTTELIRGMTLEEARQFSNQRVTEALGGLPPTKVHCPVLAEEAVKAAVEDYLRRRAK